MAKRARTSDVKPETTQALIDKVQSQAATIGDLKEKLKNQSAIWRDLKDSYDSRHERLENRCRALEDAAAIASSKHRTEVDILSKRLEDVDESKLEDIELLERLKKCNQRLLREKKDLSDAAGRYMDTIAKWKTDATNLEYKNQLYAKALEEAQEEKRDLVHKLQDAKNESEELKKQLSDGFHRFLSTGEPPAEPLEVDFSSGLDFENAHQLKRR